MRLTLLLCGIFFLRIFSSFGGEGSHTPNQLSSRLHEPPKTCAEGKKEEKAEVLTPAQELLARTVELKRFSTSAGLEAFVSLPTGSGNAADHYAKLETLYPQDRLTSEKVKVRSDAKGIEEILKGAKIRQCRLCPDYYPYMETGTDRQPDLLVHTAYLFALLERAQNLEAAGDLEKAGNLYQTGLIWGWHLCEDRPNLLTFFIGLSIQVQTARAYARFLQRRMEIAKSQAAHDFYESILQIRERAQTKARMYLGDFTNFNCLYSLVRVAKEDEDVCWRQEAVLRLGVLRHGAPEPGLKEIVKHPGYQRVAEITLMEVAEKDPQPWVRKLALWSIASITPERFAEMRAIHKFFPEEPPKP